MMQYLSPQGYWFKSHGNLLSTINETMKGVLLSYKLILINVQKQVKMLPQGIEFQNQGKILAQAFSQWP